MWNQEGKTLQVEDEFSEPESEVDESLPPKFKNGQYIYTDFVEGVYYEQGIAFNPHE